MTRLRILGIGSPSGDDQAGWWVIDALEDMGFSNRHGIELDRLDRPGAVLVSRLEHAAWVVLVDAMASGAIPGTIRHFDRTDWRGYDGGLSSHGLGVFAALELAEAMGSLPPRLDLYGIEIGAAGHSSGITPAVREAARALAIRLAGPIR
ncbi:MAG: hydrogenase maturation protease [Thiobacillus sp.]|nr:hydrogenase maturation protease [Thiobacillus sp.]